MRADTGGLLLEVEAEAIGGIEVVGVVAVAYGEVGLFTSILSSGRRL